MDRTTGRVVAERNEIIRILNGSRLYGLHHEESDHDAMAVFIEPPHYVFSKKGLETTPLHDRGAHEKAGPEEIDGMAYSLRHFISLALAGNPSILTLLFAPESFWLHSTSEGKELMSNSHYFVSMKAAPRFEGYMYSQLERLKGIKKGHIPNRPEIVEQFGYDTKYAMSVLRLGMQGSEFFETGTIVSPMSEKNIDLLKSLRFGAFSYDEAIALIEEEMLYMNDKILKKSLPQEPNYRVIYKLSQELHESWWSKK